MKTVFKQIDGAYNWWVINDDGTEVLLDDLPVEKTEEPVTPKK